MKHQVEIAKRLPSSDEAEINLLGAILLDNAALNETSFLNPEDFFSVGNQIIFRTMLEMQKDGIPIDLVTLYDKLSVADELERAGGTIYISKLMDGLPKISNVKQYCKMIYEKAILRKLIKLLDFGMQMTESQMPAQEIAEKMLESVMSLSMERSVAMLDFRSVRDVSVSQMSKSEEATILRINTGIPKLDDATGGFRAGELVTVTAGTGVGKTLLAQQIRRFACSQGLHSLYCTAEMTAEQLASRDLATESGIPHWKMRRPERITPAEYSLLSEHAVNACPTCAILDGMLSLRQIWMASHVKKRQSGLHCVIIDYDELIDAPGKDEFAQQRNLIRGAKALALSLSVPVIMISQLRKAIDRKEVKKPTLEQLYGSGAKAKHSSFVLFVDREYVRELKGDETKARICILKSRDGRVCEVPATFNLQTLTFEQVAQELGKHWTEKEE
jgi:replicative DNA helicase